MKGAHPHISTLKFRFLPVTGAYYLEDRMYFRLEPRMGRRQFIVVEYP